MVLYFPFLRRYAAVVAMSFVTVAISLGVVGVVRTEIRAAAERATEKAQPLLAGPVSEGAAVFTVTTTAQRVSCGLSSSYKTWKCVDAAGGSTVVYRGGADVTTANGFPEVAGTAFGGDSRNAWLVVASSTQALRCLCGQ